MDRPKLIIWIGAAIISASMAYWLSHQTVGAKPLTPGSSTPAATPNPITPSQFNLSPSEGVKAPVITITVPAIRLSTKK